MKNLIILALLIFAGYQAWERFAPKDKIAPLESSSYIAVYGRDSCGWTQRTLKELARNGVNYRYFVVDEPRVADLLHSRMNASGISTRRYNLPVVDVNGSLMVRPDVEVAIQQYREKLYQQAGYD